MDEKESIVSPENGIDSEAPASDAKGSVEFDTDKNSNGKLCHQVDNECDDINSGQTQKQNMKVLIAITLLKRIALLLLGYLVCYINLSLILPIIAICSLVWYENTTSEKRIRIQRKIQTSNLSKSQIQKIVRDLPSWVTFPDKEKAEWVNEIIAQLWPSLNCFIIKYCRGKIQTNIKKKFESFRFEELDFGNQAPKIDGVKVYKNTASKDSVIIDFEIFYDGDCDINFSMSGAQIGRIRDFQMGVEVRMILKPILYKIPIIGGMQIFFLNVPDINFELEGITGIPGFNFLVRQKIEEIINKKLVFPNKITKRFTKSVEAAELKSIEAEGILRVHVFEARELEKKDVTGKSDPYAILNVGAQQQKTKVICRDLNPQWDHYCEFIILDPVVQQLHFKVFDQDEFSEDDFLGSGVVEIANVIKEGKSDQWFQLENVKHGKIHLRFSWLALSSDRHSIDAAAEETRLLRIENIHSALLTIYVDSAVNLPRHKSYKKPDPYMVLTVGNNQTKSRTKRHTCNPAWEQGFYLLVRHPENDSLIINVLDKQSDAKLDKLVYNLRDLFDKPDMQISKEELPLQRNPSSTLIVSLQLRILKNATFEVDESDSDSDIECPQEQLSRTPSKKVKDNEVNNMSTSECIKSVESPIEKVKKSEISRTPTFRTSSFKPLAELGRVELSLSYSGLRQKLLVTVHRISNIPLKDPNNIPDPYVKLKLTGTTLNIKNKTKVIVDSCDPNFEETFEYLLSTSDLQAHKLIVTVKNKKLFGASVLGQFIIDLKQFDEAEGNLRGWYDLEEEQVSD